MPTNNTHEPATINRPHLSLTKDEQALLRTALSSNSPRLPATPSFGQQPGGRNMAARMPNESSARSSRNTMTNDTDVYRSPDEEEPHSGLDFVTSPLVDFDLEDGNFDWDNSGDLFGDLPNLATDDGTEHHDKRKKSTDDDDEEEEEGSGKRREGDERAARKPGRKPITGEPTTKRKAQNRAAQRAFRERKERHLKDLETKVDELEKTSETTNHENGRLRAHVERLNTEVKEYRKRLSMSAPSVGLPTPTANSVPYTAYNNSNQSSDFLFAFPKFGDLPGSYFMSNGSLAKVSPPAAANPVASRASPASVPNLARSSSSQQSPTSKSPLTPISPNGMQGRNASSQDPYQSPITSFNGHGLDELSGLFSPSVLENQASSNSADYMFPKAPQATSTTPNKSSSTDSYRASANVPGLTHAVSNGSTSSPSASSMSHTGLDSSCGTTPESSADSPRNRKISEASLNTIDEESAHLNNVVEAPCAVMTSPTNDLNGIDWLAQQNGGQFDPVLFGDYRDPQDNIMNTNLGDFFNDAFLTQDFSTPFNTGEITMSPQPAPEQQPTALAQPDPIRQCEAAQNANDDPAAKFKQNLPQFLSCDKVWDRVQRSEKVTSGQLDMDDLCSQLKSKARCSGKGAVIDEADVEAILGPSSTGHRDPFSMFS